MLRVYDPSLFEFNLNCVFSKQFASVTYIVSPSLIVPTKWGIKSHVFADDNYDNLFIPKNYSVFS